MIAEDMGVFFDPEDFASVFTVARLSPPENTVTGIFGEFSRGALDGYGIGEHRELRYSLGQPALREEDQLVRDGVTYRVRGQPEIQNDGRELVVVLTKVAP
jgi:hypothetical protein